MANLMESSSHVIYLFDSHHFKQSDSSEGMSELQAETSTWNIDKLSQVNEEGCSYTFIRVHLVQRNEVQQSLLGTTGTTRVYYTTY